MKKVTTHQQDSSRADPQLCVHLRDWPGEWKCGVCGEAVAPTDVSFLFFQVEEDKEVFILCDRHAMMERILIREMRDRLGDETNLNSKDVDREIERLEAEMEQKTSE